MVAASFKKPFTMVKGFIIVFKALFSSSSPLLTLAPDLDPQVYVVLFFSVGNDAREEEEEVSQGRERERVRGADEKTESRISSAMCQPVPVNVFAHIQYLQTHVYPPRRHPKATTVDVSACLTGQPDIRAGPNSHSLFVILGRGIADPDTGG